LEAETPAHETSRRQTRTFPDCTGSRKPVLARGRVSMPWCHLAENGDPATAVSALAHFGYGGPSLLYPLLV